MSSSDFAPALAASDVHNGGMREADLRDIPLLVEMMAQFYAEAAYALDRPRVAEAFSAILHDKRLGHIWLIRAEQQDVGYVVIAFRYAMEYSGLIACVDDLYVQMHHRNKGLSTAALFAIREFCQRTGIRALTVEVGHDNGPAQTVYRKAGFEECAGRQLLASALEAASHVL